MTAPVPTQPRITTPYGKPGSWSGGRHGGADFAAPSGSQVVAPWSGTVVEAGRTSWGRAYGTAVILDFDPLPDGSPGLWGIFAHLSSVSVKPGQRVAIGTAIGKVGSTGNSTGPHLHFEVQRDRQWRGGNNVDPQPWIDATKTGEQIVAFDYNYSGKPNGELKVAGEYVRLDVASWDPPRKGLESVMVYLNCAKLVFDGARPGRIRVRLNRLDGDQTGYQDYVVVPGITELLITHTYFEKGDGTTTAVDLKCLDGLRSMAVGTRYVKRAVVA